MELFAEYAHVIDFKGDRVSLFVARDVIYAPRRSLEIAAVAEFPIDQLPADASAATRRRIAEFRCEMPVQAQW
jgi:hypothetical protein